MPTELVRPQLRPSHAHALIADDCRVALVTVESMCVVSGGNGCTEFAHSMSSHMLDVAV